MTTPVSSVATYFGDGAGDGVWCGEDPECLLPVEVLLLLSLRRLPGHHDDERGELDVAAVLLKLVDQRLEQTRKQIIFRRLAPLFLHHDDPEGG